MLSCGLQDLKFEKSKQAGLCNNFIHGKCHYGDRCKYSHDTSAYLANKQPDLPGRCPFSLLDLCPYGECPLIAQHVSGVPSSIVVAWHSISQPLCYQQVFVLCSMLLDDVYSSQRPVHTCCWVFVRQPRLVQPLDSLSSLHTVREHYLADHLAT